MGDQRRSHRDQAIDQIGCGIGSAAVERSTLRALTFAPARGFPQSISTRCSSSGCGLWQSPHPSDRHGIAGGLHHDCQEERGRVL
jgi:hypothetical protein